MAEPNRQSLGSGGRTAFGLRPVAIGLMLIGVAGFILSRLFFGEQVLLQLLSTLITFAGLGMILAARRMGWGRSEAGEAPEMTERTAKTIRSEPQDHMPLKGKAANEAGILWMEQLAEPQNNPLAERAATLFRQQGAQVAVEAQRPDRSLFIIHTREDEVFTAMVFHTTDPVDVADVRGLFALVASRGSTGGLLIASGGFTPRAVAWAEGKPIRLVTQDNLDNLNI